MADFTLAALKAEIDTDPESLGYKIGVVWKSDQTIADLLNLKNLVIDRARVDMEDVRGQTSFDNYNPLSIDEQEYIRWQTPNGGRWLVTAHMKLDLTGRALIVNGAPSTANDNASFWAASQRTNVIPKMLALIEIPGSRSEVLWGEGQNITAGNVGAAANV